MSIFYHVDRSEALNPNDEIKLVHHNDLVPDFLQEHVDSLFPDGVSVHGDRYFLNNASSAVGVDPIIELVFEYVRRSNYPHRQSRFQSFFAFKSFNDAIDFREKYGNGVIWEVECDDSRAFTADMNNLTLNDSLLVLSYRASCYWGGLPNASNQSPIWEVLLTPPIKIIRSLQK